MASCDYDYLDCKCAPNCPFIDLGKCKPECLVQECNYDQYPGYPSCPSELNRTAAYFYQLIVSDFTSLFDFSASSAATNCTFGDFNSSLTQCVQACNMRNLLYSFGNCQPIDNNIHCDRMIYSMITPSICASCEDGYVNLYGICNSYCQYGFQPSVFNPKLCVPIIPDSSDSLEYVLYVNSSDAVPLNATGDGSELNPFSSLSQAFSTVSHKYTRIVLYPGTHFLTLEFQSPFLAPLPTGSTIDPHFPQNVLKLIIEAMNCSFWICQRPIIKFLTYLPVSLNFVGILELRNVDFNGNSPIVKGCANFRCFYPAYYAFSYMTWAYYDDRNNKIDMTKLPNFAIPSFAKFGNNVFISLLYDCNASFENVTFSDFRQGFNMLIQLHGNLQLLNVNFHNIYVKGQYYTYPAVIGFMGDNPAVFSYENGNVTYLNNGFEYQTNLIQGGFLFVRSSELVYLSNVRFAFNTVINYGEGLIFLLTLKSMHISQCRFENNFLAKAQLFQLYAYVDMSVSNYQQFVDNSKFQIEVSNCVFRNNSVVDGSLISVYYMLDFANMLIADNEFINNLSVTQNLILVQSYYFLSDRSISGYRRAVFNSTGNRIWVDIPLTQTVLRNLTFLNCYSAKGLIYIAKATNIYLQTVRIQNITQSSINFYTNTLLAFVQNPDIYMKSDYSSSATQICSDQIFISNANSVSIQNSHFTDIICNNGTAGAHFENITQTVSIMNSSFVDLIGNNTYGGVISLNTPQVVLRNILISASGNVKDTGVITAFGVTNTLIIDNSTFEGCFSTSGAVVTALEQSQIALTNTRFAENRATTYGGVILVSGVSEGITTLTISQCEFIKNSANLGGTIYFKSSPGLLSVNIHSSAFQMNTGIIGSVIYIPNLKLTNDSVINDSHFQSNVGRDQGVLYLQYVSGLLTISDCEFENNIAQISAVIYGIYQSQLVLSNTLFQNNIAQAIISQTPSNTNQSCSGSSLLFYNNTGVCLNLISSIFSCTKCKFVSNEASSGPVLYLESGSTATLTHSDFTDNTAIKNGGVALIRNKSILNATSCLFQNNTSGDAGGVLYIELQSQAILTDSVLKNNTSTLEGSAISAVMNSQLSVLSTQLISNVGNGVISLLASEAILTWAYIAENTASGNTAGIVIMLSTLSATNSVFANQTSQQGTFVSASSLSTVSLQNCSFLDGTADTAGAAVRLYESQLSIAKCTFRHLTATYGSSIIGSINSTIEIIDSEFSYQHSQQPNGGIIFTYDSTLYITNSYFTLFNEGALSISRASLKLDLSSFGCNSYAAGKGSLGSAIYSSDCSDIAISNSNFQSLISDVGGSLYFSGSQVSKVTILNCIFYNNTASDSGAIFADRMNIDFMKNHFISNKATLTNLGLENRGGAITTLCPIGNCNYSFSNNTFTNNTALLKGGAIYWGNIQPNITADNIFSGNTATYGNDVASFALNLVSLNVTSLEGVASGQPSNQVFVLELLDHYQQVVSIDNSSSAYINTNRNGTEISGDYKSIAVQGVLTFQDFILVATPKQHTQINVTASQPIQLNTTYVEFNVSMRDCIIGENLVNNLCVTCPPGKYSLNPKLDCQTCPEGAVCLGNFTMLPKPGYWRSGNYSDVFFVCPNPNSCLGSTDFSSPTGVCDTGYEGNKCEACSSGYSQYSKIYCLPCPNFYLNVFRIVGFLILLLVFAIMIVKSSLKSATRLKSKFSIYLKILMNYVQLTMLMSALNMNWPSLVLQLFQVHDSSGSMVDQVVSVDCLLSSQSESDAFFIRLILMSSTPIILGVLSLFIWLIVALLKHDSNLLRNECIATIVILFFTVHPSVTRMMFKTFQCEQIDPNQFWMIGYDIRCWESTHLKYSLALAIPSLIIWGIGVPALCWLYLRRNRNQLEKSEMRVKFGYLFNMYDCSKYYWEFIILYRKLLLISITIFLFSFSIISQAIIVLAVLLIFQLLQYKTLPYTNEKLNELELRCLWVSIITVNSGLFFYSNQLNDVGQVLFFILIVATNCHFLILWAKIACVDEIKTKLRKMKCCRRWFLWIHAPKRVSTLAFSRKALLTHLYLREIQ